MSRLGNSVRWLAGALASAWRWLRDRREQVAAVIVFLGQLATVASVYFAWSAADAAREAVALQSRAMQMERDTRRPYLRVQHKALKDDPDGASLFEPHGLDAETKKLPPGSAKRVVLEITNSGQRVASGIHGDISARLRSQQPDAPDHGLANMICPSSTINDVAPGDSFEMECPVYVPVHDLVLVTITYVDEEAGGEERCQSFTYSLRKDAINDASGYVALALRPSKCGPLVPEWVKRSIVTPPPPSLSPTPKG